MKKCGFLHVFLIGMVVLFFISIISCGPVKEEEPKVTGFPCETTDDRIYGTFRHADGVSSWEFKTNDTLIISDFTSAGDLICTEKSAFVFCSGFIYGVVTETGCVGYGKGDSWSDPVEMSADGNSLTFTSSGNIYSRVVP